MAMYLATYFTYVRIVGRHVAKIIADERTLSKRLTQNQLYDIL